jgi:hypothetical protein
MELRDEQLVLCEEETQDLYSTISTEMLSRCMVLFAIAI